MPVSNQVVPVQPAEARYGIEKLYLTPRWTRATYLEHFKEQAPAYNPAYRIKRWFLTDVLEGSEDPATELVSFHVWDQDAKVFKTISMTKLEASVPNLPGSITWPKYINAMATPAKIVGPEGDSTPLNGDMLVDPVVAKAIAEEITKDTGVEYRAENVPDMWPYKVMWGTETRRNMVFTNGEQSFGAADLLKKRFEKGVGSPGKWILAGGPVFVPDVPPTGELDLRPEIPMPCRKLLPNERLEISPFAVFVVRKDLTVNEPAPGTGALTVAQDAAIKEILAGVREIKQKLGI